MSRNTSVSLGAHFDDFIASQLARGHYSTASEVLRAGLRLLETQETHAAALRRLLDEGEASGDADYSLAELVAELDAAPAPDAAPR